MKMKISYRVSYLGFFLFQILSSILIIKNLDFLGIIPVFLLTYFLIFPGFLLLRSLGISLSSRFNQIVHSVGLSLSVFMFGGLFLNIFLPFIGIQRPLTQLNTIIFLNIFVFIVGFVSYSKEKKQFFDFHLGNIDIKNILFSITPIVFIIQAMAGAQTLNNGGSSLISIALLIEIILYCLMIVLLNNRLNKKIIHPIALFSISTSVLLMLSMRSYHVVGWDINQELYVFQLTKRLSVWSMLNYQNAYNSCLSITILPTMLSFLVKLNDEYLFKFLYPLMFSLAPVGMYYMMKNFAKKNIAFLSVLIFIFQPPFILQITMLARQEIAMFFLVLLLYAFFLNKLSDSKKAFIFLTYYFSLVLSHYSTTYITLFLFLMVFVITQMRRILKTLSSKVLKINKVEARKTDDVSTNTFVSWKIITIMFVFTFLWNSTLTNNTDDLVYAFKNTWNSMDKVFTNGLKSVSVNPVIWNRREQFTAQDVVNYAIETTKEYQASKPYITKYDQAKYSSYTAEPVYSKIIPYEKYIDMRILYIYPYISTFLKISLIVGFIYLLLNKTGKKIVSVEYKIMCLFSLVLIAIFMFLPYISLSYNLERVIQQCLIMLTLPMILGLYFIWRTLFIRKEKLIFFISSLIILIYFIFPSGLVNQFAGGTGYLQLNNFGEYYNRYYFHKSEQSSLQWMSDHYDKNSYIYADTYAKLKILPFSSIKQNIITDILPSVIDKNAYVYSSYSNTIDKLAIAINRNTQEISYNFPSNFLNNNKNKIYSNGYSELFK